MFSGSVCAEQLSGFFDTIQAILSLQSFPQPCVDDVSLVQGQPSEWTVGPCDTLIESLSSRPRDRRVASVETASEKAYARTDLRKKGPTLRRRQAVSVPGPRGKVVTCHG